MRSTKALALLLTSVMAFALLAPVAAFAAAGNMVELKIELPKPQFSGTPKTLPRIRNLERPTGKARPPFMAPKGTELISKGKPVTSSDPAPIIGELSYLTDGDKEAVDGSFVELGPGVQWVQIDLEKEYQIYAIVIWHYHSEARVYYDVVVKVGDDQDMLENAKTVYNNDEDNSAGQGYGKDMTYVESNEGRLIDTKGVKGRYVRLYSKGNTSNEMNHYTEVEVYGKPVQ